MFSKSLERKIARRYSTLGCVYMQVLFTRVNEVETSYELFRFKREVERGSTFTFTRNLSCINFLSFIFERKFYGGEGYSTNFYTGRLPFIYHFSRKRYSFRIPSIDKWNSFHIPCLELCIPLHPS